MQRLHGPEEGRRDGEEVVRDLLVRKRKMGASSLESGRLERRGLDTDFAEQINRCNEKVTKRDESRADL